MSEEKTWSSPAGDLLLAAGQVSCVAASLYSVSAEPGLHRLTENTLDTYGLSARLTAHTNTKRNRSPLSGPYLHSSIVGLPVAVKLDAQLLFTH